MIRVRGTVIQFEINSFLQVATFQDLKKWGTGKGGRLDQLLGVYVCVGEGQVKEGKKEEVFFFFKPMRERGIKKINEQ